MYESECWVINKKENVKVDVMWLKLIKFVMNITRGSLWVKHIARKMREHIEMVY